MVAGHRFSLDVLSRAALAFVCFCAVASSGYLINDLLDRAADGAHPRKKDRPIASGALRRATAVALAALLGITGLAGAWMIGPGFGLVVAIYLCGSIIYSILLKPFAIVDVVVLAALFTLRVIGGGEATAISLSHWLLTLSLFLFLALAIAKRSSELAIASKSGRSGCQGAAMVTPISRRSQALEPPPAMPPCWCSRFTSPVPKSGCSMPGQTVCGSRSLS